MYKVLNDLDLFTTEIVRLQPAKLGAGQAELSVSERRIEEPECLVVPRRRFFPALLHCAS